MPASWRPSRGADVEGSATDEICALAGVDEMTIPSNLLDVLESSEGQLPRQCRPSSAAATCNDLDTPITEALFQELMAADVCATEKLKEGMDAFIADTEKLEEEIISRM